MRASFLPPIAAVGLLALGLLGCDDAQCAIDTDCPLRQRCAENNQCVPVGVEMDGGGDVDSGPAEDAGDPEDGGTDAGTDAGPSFTGVGSVTAVSEMASGAESHIVTAFFSVVDPDAENPCATTEVGACSLQVCEDTTPPMDAGPAMDAGPPVDAGPGMDAGPPEAKPNAGTIQVTGGTLVIALSPDDAGDYSAATGTTRLWTSPEAMLAYRSTPGADVPMFNVTLGGTSQPILTLPPSPLSRSMDLTLTWAVADGASLGDGEMVLTFFRADGGTASTTLTCRAAVADGTITVAAAALGSFATADNVSFAGNVVNESVEELSNWTVTIGNRSSALAADGARAQNSVVISD